MENRQTKIREESKEFSIKVQSKVFHIEISPKLIDETGKYKKVLESDEAKKIIENFLHHLDRMNDIPTVQKKQAIEAYKENSEQSKTILKSKPPFIPVVTKKLVPPTVKPIFKLQNFRIDEEKSVYIEIESSEQISILDVKLPETLGLWFDRTDSKIYGTPIQAGDFQISLQWSNSEGIKNSETMTLSVINNPKNLWKNLPSNINDPYFKPDTAVSVLETKTHFMCSASIRGRAHAHVGGFRDDDFFMYADESNDWGILIVADGAGSAKNSRKGSLLACQNAGESIKNDITTKYDDIYSLITNYDLDEKDREAREQFYYILGNAFKKAICAIQEESIQKGVLFKEYSTTLLISICFQFNQKLFIASAMIGDGAIGVYTHETNQIDLLGSADSGEFAGQTRFLDNSVIDASFWDRVIVRFYNKPTALLLMTDGISDPRFETDNGLKNAELWKKLWLEIKPIIDSDGKERESSLLEWMEFFRQGHHDDRTIAIYKIK